MRIVWPDGTFEYRRLGAKLIGLKRNGQRPQRIVLTALEVLQLEERPSYRRHIARACQDRCVSTEQA